VKTEDNIKMNCGDVVTFQVLTAASLKMTIFWDVAPCSLIEDSGVFAASIIRAMMEEAITSETSLNIYQTARCNIPEDSRIHTVMWFQVVKGRSSGCIFP
jgi:hypothetical protein